MLTAEYIKTLDQFCEQKGIQYYDLRLELVDHLAESIENKIAENPGLSFDAALTAVYQSFGKGGFADLVEERRAILTQAHKKEYWKHIRHYFEWPRIVLSIAILVIAFIPTFFIPAADSRVIYSLCVFLVPVLMNLLQARYFRRRFKPIQPLISLYGLNWRPLMLTSLFFAYRIVLFVFNTKIDEVPLSAPFFLTLGVAGLIFELSSFEARKNLYTKAIKEYPLAFMKKTF
ncbi:hypothetical protein [Niabella sp.]|uniref:hypothetical protein n=1 Tax=Niabella sp. TaxID=1962976 RepID=UPI0026345EAD|nr:hypothetical protein [Niabella sp.]